MGDSLSRGSEALRANLYLLLPQAIRAASAHSALVG